MELHIKVVGTLLVCLALLHVVIPRFFNWARELTSLSLITRQVVYVHTFFIGFTVLLMGAFCLFYSHELVFDPLGRVISLGLFGFWLTRLIFQFLVYSPRTWRGKRFETIVHVTFVLTWFYISGVFLFAYVERM